MVLGILFDHSFTDGIGAATVARVWAAYCRGEDGSQLISPEIMDRTQLSNGDESARIEEFKEFVYCPEARTSVPAPGFLNRMFLSFPSFRSPFDFGLNFMKNVQRVLRGNLAGGAPRSDPNLVTGEIFFIPEAMLKELKAMASNLESDKTSWISTHNAIASLTCSYLDLEMWYPVLTWGQGAALPPPTKPTSLTNLTRLKIRPVW